MHESGGRGKSVVIGGGIAGMTCALLLARQGMQVTLVERSRQLGPTVRGFSRGGLYFESGFHYAGSIEGCGLLQRLLDRLGISDDIEVASLPDGGCLDQVCFRDDGRGFCFPQGWEALEGNLSAQFPEHSDGIASYLAAMRRVWRLMDDSFPERSEALAELLMSGEGGTQADAFVSHGLSDPALQSLLSAHNLLYGTMPSETSFVFHSLVIGSYYESMGMVRGGGRALVLAFENALCEAGVVVVTGEEASTITLDGGRVAGIELATGGVLPADTCVCSSHPSHLLRMLPERAFRPVYRSRIAEFADTPSALVLFARAEKTGVAPGNRILLDSSSGGAENWRSRELADRPHFVSVASDDTAGVSVICPMGWEELRKHGLCDAEHERVEDYRARKKALGDALLESVCPHVEEWLGRLELIDAATPITFSDQLNAPHGALYGIKHLALDMPLLPRTRVGGLFLAGQAIVAPGIMGAICSGFTAASAATDEVARK